jgi:hypothetical protein
MHRLPITSFFLASVLCADLASAATVVLTPLANVQGADAKRVDGIRQLMSSELEFSPGVDGVKEVPNANEITDPCLMDPRCLAGIAQRAGGDQLLTGKVTPSGGNFNLDLVFYDGQSIARRRQFVVPNDSTAMANQMTPIVQEMLTGVNPQSSGGAASVDDFDVDDLPEEESPAVAMAPPIAAAYQPPPQPAYAPPPQPAYAPPPQPAYAPPPQPAYTPPPAPAPVSDADAAGMISFGASAAEISAEEVDQMIQFGAPSAAPAPAPVYTPPPQPAYQPPPQPAYQPPPQPAAPVYSPPPQPAYQAQPGYPPAYGQQPYTAGVDPNLAREEAESQGRIQNIDEEPSGRKARSSGSTGTVERDIANTMQITVRGGYAKYFVFDFATVGGEVAVPVAGNFHLLAGLEGYAVNRVLPLELQIATGIESEWNTIFPVNLGGMYKFTPPGIAQPYVGADVIFVQYYKDEIGADWAGGARVRGGCDFMIIDNFGLNVNLAVGGWTGKNWSLIQDGVGQSGLLPQVSAGTVIAF